MVNSWGTTLCLVNKHMGSTYGNCQSKSANHEKQGAVGMGKVKESG